MQKITHIVPTWFPDETRERNAYQLGSALGSRVLRVGEGHDEADAYNDPQEEADEEPHWRSSCRGLPIRVYYGRGEGGEGRSGRRRVRVRNGRGEMGTRPCRRPRLVTAT
ncbi:hypothetical protein BHE74_00009553 [Ensete ventricosum]|nr:hypothetical protein BHE74_00009553 [Ensete ventricosum]